MKIKNVRRDGSFGVCNSPHQCGFYQHANLLFHAGMFSTNIRLSPDFGDEHPERRWGLKDVCLELWRRSAGDSTHRFQRVMKDASVTSRLLHWKLKRVGDSAKRYDARGSADLGTMLPMSTVWPKWKHEEKIVQKDFCSNAVMSGTSNMYLFF